MKRSVKVLALLVMTFVCMSSVDANGRFRGCRSTCQTVCESSFNTCNVTCAVTLPGDEADPGHVMTLYYCVKDPKTSEWKWKARKFGIGADPANVVGQLWNVADKEGVKNWITKGVSYPVQTKPVIDMVYDAKDVECFAIARAGSLDDRPCDCKRNNNPIR